MLLSCRNLPSRTAGQLQTAKSRSKSGCLVVKRHAQERGAVQKLLAVQKSSAETFVESLEVDQEDGGDQNINVELLQKEIDLLYENAFGDVELPPDNRDGTAQVVSIHSEEDFVKYGKSRDISKLVDYIRKDKPADWMALQMKVTRLQRLRKASSQSITSSFDDEPDEADGDIDMVIPTKSEGAIRCVLLAGFETFNITLYKKVAESLKNSYPQIQVLVFTERDIENRKLELESVLREADVLFCSLLFDYDQVEWLRSHTEQVPVRFIFESALELMSITQAGSFDMKPSDKGPAGPPPIVKSILKKFGSKKEEDKLLGYISFLKIGPKLLRFVPGNRAKDLRRWLTVYSYWNEGGFENVINMFLFIFKEYFATKSIEVPIGSVVSTPQLGVYHPNANTLFPSLQEYMSWYRQTRKPDINSPVVAVLLYRKHVITKQAYLGQLVTAFEREGLVPVPVFINGVEAHTVVRDILTSDFEQQQIKAGRVVFESLKKDAVKVNAVISTIGFPLVGGPAGSMEGSRQADLAKEILTAKNVPYFVAAPLLVQDVRSWADAGVNGLQSVVLYALPELDGAIDATPLGALIREDVIVIEERLQKVIRRMKSWIKLRSSLPKNKKIAILMYGFPPNVGAVGTAALLNVPKSLENLLRSLADSGYDLGEIGPILQDPNEPANGEAIIKALEELLLQPNVNAGTIPSDTSNDLLRKFGEYVSISPLELEELLGHDVGIQSGMSLPEKIEKQWGKLEDYRGISTSSSGSLMVSGLRFGNVFIGVQPVLGIEGDPMRLLFQRDLTPHPQYVAFYKWLQDGFAADAILHFGMHGTVEWLPGAPLGNTFESWADNLLGTLPNLYIYAANNPSESIIAKRRGYGTIVSHNVPPYSRTGLYKQLALLKDVLAEYREDPTANQALKVCSCRGSRDFGLRNYSRMLNVFKQGTIVDTLNSTGLQQDCPFTDGQKEVRELTAENVDKVDEEEFKNYAMQVTSYLQVLENRLFSEGLHVLGQKPSAEQVKQYLSAYFEGALNEKCIQAIANGEEDLPTLLEFGNSTSANSDHEIPHLVTEALDIASRLRCADEEIKSILAGLSGQFIPPAMGGDLLRDGKGVLPTGRNIYALDPYRMPSPGAVARGQEAALKILEQHQQSNAGEFPETVAVTLWGLDAIKTRGESVAIVLTLVGAKPVMEGTGRIARFELIPLSEMGGRPRVDCLASMSGIFRDSFANVVDLIDDLFKRAAEADEPLEKNYIRKHALDMESKGIDRSHSRLFCNPSGDYGSMVTERVSTGDWSQTEELASTWKSRNSYSYGRGSESGTDRPEVLETLLQSTTRIVQEVDSVEYGLTDIQEYYGNTGALAAAAASTSSPDQANGNEKRVVTSIVEAFSKKVDPKDLDEVLRMEYRSKLLNPKWAQAMAAQGSGGAYEISQRMTAMVGWGGTTGFAEDWVYNEAVETYVDDPEMAALLRRNNPQAFSNIVRRFLEASRRGLWKADPDLIERLEQLYFEMDAELEGRS